MDSHSIMLIISLAVLLMMSAYFSATETAFSSLNRIKIKNLAANGDQKAELVLKLTDNYDKLISTVLIGNNIVNITLSAIATVLFVTYFKTYGVPLATAVMTVLVLLFGEITPKTIAKETPEKFAISVAGSILFFLNFLTPLVILFGMWQKLLFRVFKISGDQSITDEELLTLVEEAQKEGGLAEDDGELITSAIEFHNLTVADILTARVDLAAIPQDAEKEDIMAIFRETGYSRLPVYDDTIDRIIGVIHLKDFYNEVAYTDEKLEKIIKPTVFIPKTVKISKLMLLLKEKKSHIAVVLDEFGGTLGIVTLEDVLEELVGDIWDEHDVVESEYEKISDTEYLIFCGTEVDVLEELFGFEPETDATTVNGWVIEEMGSIPEPGETFQYQNLFITISKVEQRRVTEIYVKVLEPEEMQKRED